MKYISRNLETVVSQLTKEYPVVLLTGPRQVGKSTLFDNIIEPNRRKVTLDDFDYEFVVRNNVVDRL